MSAWEWVTWVMLGFAVLEGVLLGFSGDKKGNRKRRRVPVESEDDWEYE